MASYYVYILSNQSRTFYVGMTNDLARRIQEHKLKLAPGFTARYNVTQLVHYEEYPSAWDAIEREKKLKGWGRAKETALIETKNPRWQDLAEAWFSADGRQAAGRPDPSRSTALDDGLGDSRK